MAKYRIDWTTEEWHSMIVEADSRKDAEERWSNSGMMFSAETVYESGFVPEGSIEILEVSNEQE